MRHPKVFVLLIAVFLIATGWTDLDWMIVSYYFQIGNGLNGVWEFCPYLKVEWWLAFELTLARLFIGWLLLGMIVLDMIKNE